MKKGSTFIEWLVVIGIIGILFGVVYGGLNSLCVYNPDYTCNITVDKSEKIEQAISNCFEDIKSRNFIVIGLEVRRNSNGKKEIICKGITKANLIKDD